MKYIAIFHANLNYAYLTPDKYEFVIRGSYELILDTMKEYFPDTKYVFEASGYTIEQIAVITPDVLDKLKAAISSGMCEFMGSPYAHPMLPNFPKEDGVWSIQFSNKVYMQYLGMQPKSFWNPECGWRSYVPQQVAECGYKNMIGDFEAYSRSCTADGTPQRPEIYDKEFSKEPAFYNFAFKYDLPGHEKAIHFPFDKIDGLENNSLRMFLRTDRVAQFAVRYFMGMKGYSFEEYISLISKYSEQTPGEPEGALIIFADDAEYVGTNGWFRLKFQNKPDNVFERTPQSKDNLIRLITEVSKMGEFINFDQACNGLEPIPDTIYFDDDCAWHGAKASTWANTPMARMLRAWQDLVREKLNAMGSSMNKETLKRAWYHLTNSYNSDGQWPPTLPDAPHIVHPFNYGYCFDSLLKAEILAGGVDRSRLPDKAVETLRQILGIQQELVLQKAATMKLSADDEEREKADLAITMIEQSRDVSSIAACGGKLLYASEYTVRAEALVEARRIVGGVLIEKI